VDAISTARELENQKLRWMLILFPSTALLVWAANSVGVIPRSMIWVWILRIWVGSYVWNLIGERFYIQSRRIAKIEERLDAIEQKIGQ
jgi:hypothetical protein